MPEIPTVSTWMQVVVVIAVLGYLAFKAWLDSGRTKQTNDAVTALEATLTTNNGGSHVKDQLDRIEASVGDLAERVTVLEGTVTRRPKAVAQAAGASQVTSHR
ncbi:hypothetical protein G5C66_07815 [Nocardioides sp. KC13]|uniref:Uncharacterized protein n=1 Tax=Nocardioides turkmenicus TaxID=2711220 RepID=A0A6M1QS08_9ACTN|nr:hypothetical protein [Nocardioides sp. KC13]NGN92643.1 hypothetical protein [Nocardioides sp. KC13]